MFVKVRKHVAFFFAPECLAVHVIAFTIVTNVVVTSFDGLTGEVVVVAALADEALGCTVAVVTYGDVTVAVGALLCGEVGVIKSIKFLFRLE